MTDYPFQIAVLIQKSIVGVLTDEEREQLERWMAESDEHERMYREFVRPGFLEEARKEHHQFQAGEGYRRFVAGKRKSDRLRIGKRWAAVAAMGTLVIGVALAFLLREQSGTEQDGHLPVAEVIKPGKAGAVLTLSDGRQVVLSDSLETQLKERTADIRVQGKRLDYSAEHVGPLLVYNTITVPRGGEYQLTLADGTQVWLNAETELKYPVAFADEVREVMLTGEAYFEVAKNVSRPFVVKAGQLDIKVLGTSFNVKAYPSETQQATLVQGKVEVCAGNYSRKLQPGEQLNYSSEGPEIRNVDVKAYTAWKDRRFVFNDDLLEEVIRKLGRWYDVEFILRDAEVREIRFTGNLPKYRNLDQVLNKLELTTHIRFVPVIELLTPSCKWPLLILTQQIYEKKSGFGYRVVA